MAEKKSLSLLVKDYEEMRINEEVIVDQLSFTNKRNKELGRQLCLANKAMISQEKQIKILETKITKISEEANSQKSIFSKTTIQQDLLFSHIETKNRLLTESLNKRNEDVKALGNGNEDLINLLEKCDDKIQKLDEDYRVERMRAEKYEALIEGDRKIDIESLDGRINFLVSTLEEYRRILEEDSEIHQEGDECDEIREEMKNMAYDDFLVPVRSSFKSYSFDHRVDNENTFNT
jgi:small-conductance mechanosensitive channel